MISKTRIVAGLMVGATVFLAGFAPALFSGARFDASIPIVSAATDLAGQGTAPLIPSAEITDLESAFAAVAERGSAHSAIIEAGSKPLNQEVTRCW